MKKTKKIFVKSLWDELNLSASYSPYAPYQSDKIFSKYWRTFQINELGHRDIFIQSDRISLLISQLSQSFRIDNLLKENAILDYFPLHDDFILFQKSKISLFIKVLDVEKLVKPEHNQQRLEIQNFLDVIRDNADTSDFIDKPLTQYLKFSQLYWWHLDIDPIRDYFGEKIAIYFSLLTFYGKSKLFMGIVGIVIEILHGVFNNENSVVAYKITTLVYAGLVLIWAIFFGEFWVRRQALFAMRYGQVHNENEIEKRIIRSGFRGTYIRDITNNEMNVLYYPNSKRMGKYFITYFIEFICLIILIITSLAILLWKKTVDPTDSFKITMISLFQTLVIIVFQIIFTKMAIAFTNLKNHGNLETHYKDLAFQLTLLYFVNTFNSLVLIAFVKPYTSYFGECLQTNNIKIDGIDCFNELSVQVRTTFIIQFIMNFVPILILFLKQRILQKVVDKFRTQFQIKNYEWMMIDRKIEEEDKRENYRFENIIQIDGTLADFLQTLTEYQFLSMFSISFPLAFLIAFFGGILKIHLDKMKFYYFYKRIIPQNTNSIGIFQAFFERTIYFTIFCNAAIIVFTLQGLSVDVIDMESKLRLFLIIVIIALVVKLVAQFFVSDIPENFKLLNQRHERLKMMLQNSQFTNSSAYLRAGVWLNLNSNIEEDFDFYED